MLSKIAVSAITALLLLISVDSSHAQAFRTWVSGLGNDANLCTRTAPCATFMEAIAKTAVGGEISVLDPGGFGAVTITKSISIVSEGSEGSILGCGTTGIIINSATAVVNIHGLFIEGCGNGGISPGLSGIRIVAAASVHIRKTLIRGFTEDTADTYGITVENSGTTRVFVSDSTISNNLRGIRLRPAPNGTSIVTLDNVKVEKNNTGIVLRKTTGATSEMWLNNSVITNNSTGLSVASGTTLNSFGNNVIANNNTDGAPTATIPLR